MENKKQFHNSFGQQHIFILVIGLLLPLSMILSMFVGAEKNTFKDFFLAISTENETLSYLKIIILKIRLPRTILALLSGILLGGTGCVLQGFFRNPLSDSGILGISSGATFGAALCTFLISLNLFQNIFTKISSFWLMNLFAFCGAVLCVCILLVFSHRLGAFSSATNLLLTGTALSALLGSGASILLLFNSKELRPMFVWTLGSFNGRSWTEVYFIWIPAVCSIILLLFSSRFLDVLTSGEKSAKSLGLNIKFIMTLTLVSSSLATACSVCSGGIIGFVGLVSPHIVRRFCRINHKILVPLSMVVGGIIILVSDVIARIIIAPSELPIGVITSLIGAPIFVRILYFGVSTNEAR